MKTANYFKHKNPTWRTMIIAGLAGLSLAGCRDNDFDWDAAYGTKLDYIFAKEFQKQFGEIDPTHDWSTGTVITADVDLSAWTSGSAVLRVMTSMPILDDCVMLYKGTVSGASTIYFDAPRHLTHVYVTAEQDGKYVLGQYFEIEDETCSIKASETRARTNDVCYTTINQNKKVDLTKDGKASTKYYLTDVHKSKDDATKLTIRDLVKYVGKGSNAYFPEGKIEMKGPRPDNNREKFDKIFSRDVIYTVAEEGPVWVDCFFGATAFYNQFGYYYYREGSTPEETLNNKKSADRYVLIDDARPNRVVTVEPEGDYPWWKWPGMRLAEYWIDGYENKNNNVRGTEIATGTKYRLVYFEEGKAPSFNFPKDIKIGFFIHKIDNEEDKNSNWLTNDGLRNNEGDKERIRYSDSDLNAFYYPDLTYKGDPYWAAVSCRIGDKIVCGFEDNPVISESDHDMNDIMFFVEGVDPSDIPDIPVPEPQLSECIIAYEDLGTTDDFDFNDVVISVSAPQYGYSFIKLLAAGGTLNTKVIYKGVSGDIELNFCNPNNNIDDSAGTGGTEVHSAFGVRQTTMVNTGRAKPNVNYVPTAKIIAPTGWTVGANKQRFAIKVQQAKGEVKIVNIPYTEGEAPQAFLIADPNWKWPNERQNIKDKYSGFEDWVHNNLTNNTWYSKAWDEQSSNN